MIKSFMLISKKPDIIKLNTVYEIEYILNINIEKK